MSIIKKREFLRRLYVTCLQNTIQELYHLNSFDSTVQSNSSTCSKTIIYFQLSMIVSINSKHWKISKLNEAVFIDQNVIWCQAVSFRRDVILVNRFSEAPEGTATKDILCLVENTSVRVVEELEIEEETFLDLQASILNSRDQIRGKQNLGGLMQKNN